MIKSLDFEFTERVGTFAAIPIIDDVAFTLSGGLEGAAQAFAGNRPNADIYARPHNPTVQFLADAINRLEGGKGAVAFASGQAAVDNVIRLLASNDTEVVVSRHVFGGTVALQGLYARSGITFKFADPANPDSFEKLANEKTRLFLVESAANPGGEIAEFDGIGLVAKKHNIPFAVDNTTTPLLFRPFEHHADIVIYSMTKYINGFGNAIAGGVVDGGQFDWNGDIRFPALSSSAGGTLSLAEKFLGCAFYKGLQSQLTVGGAILGPHSAETIYRNMASLPQRLSLHIANTQVAAEFLKAHDAVERVHHAGLPDDPSHARMKKYMPHGTPGPILVTLKGGQDAAARFISRSEEFFRHAVNIGDSGVSLVSHPSSTTHRQLTQEQKLANGIGEGSVRLSISTGDVKETVEALRTALEF